MRALTIRLPDDLHAVLRHLTEYRGCSLDGWVACVSLGTWANWRRRDLISRRAADGARVATKSTSKSVVAFTCAGLAVLVALSVYAIHYWLARDYWPLMLDFRYLYTAGKVWTEGASPYLEGWSNIIAQPHGELAPFPYPPNWWAPSLLVAQLSPWGAHIFWQAVCLGSLVATAWCMAEVTVSRRSDYSPFGSWVANFVSPRMTVWFLTLLFMAYIVATKGSGTNAFLGQTGALVALGLAATVVGVALKVNWAISVGIILMLLKPHVGLPFAMLLLLPPTTRVPTLIGGIITGLSMLPPLLMHGPVEVVTSFLANVSIYGSRVENFPIAMSGVANFIFRASGFTLSPVLSVLLSIPAAFAGWIWLKSRMPSHASELALLTSTTLSVLFFVPLHDWDFGLIFVLFPYLFVLRGPALWIALALLVPLSRANELFERLLTSGHWLEQQQVSATSFAICVCGCIFVAVLAALPMRAPSRPGT